MQRFSEQRIYTIFTFTYYAYILFVYTYTYITILEYLEPEIGPSSRNMNSNVEMAAVLCIPSWF